MIKKCTLLFLILLTINTKPAYSTYVGSDPVNNIDPTGLSPALVPLLLAVGAGVLTSTPTDTPISTAEELGYVGLNTLTGFGIGQAAASACASGSLRNSIATEFTEHGLQRAAARSISNAEIDSAIMNNISASAGPARYGNTVLFVGQNGVRVVIGTTGKNAGKIITVFK